MVLCDKNCGEVLKRKEIKKLQEEACPNEITECPFAYVGWQESITTEKWREVKTRTNVITKDETKNDHFRSNEDSDTSCRVWRKRSGMFEC